MTDMIDLVARYLLLFIFCVGVVVSATRPRPVVDIYQVLRMPPWFPFVTAAMEGLAVALLIRTGTVTWGALLSAAIMGAAILMMLRVREYGHLVPPFVTMALGLWVAYRFVPVAMPLPF